MSRFDEKDLQNLKDVLNTDFKAKKSKKCVKEFEEKFAKKFNSKYGISCCNGTATLHGILIGMGIKEGDEVITTPLTMSSTSLCFTCKCFASICRCRSRYFSNFTRIN